MSRVTKIEWCDASWNPVMGCTPVSPGCLNCYAARLAARFAKEGGIYDGLAVHRGGRSVFTTKIRYNAARLADPLRWKKPKRIFVNSMSDLFHEDVDFGFVDCVFGAMQLAQRHTYLILTKRPERMLEYMRQASKDAIGAVARRMNDDVPTDWASWPPANVWMGTSVENQDAAYERLPSLQLLKGWRRFVSFEPLIGPVQISSFAPREWLDWAIIGGETGPGARPCQLDWMAGLIGDCRISGIPVFVKQLGANPVIGDGARMVVSDFKDMSAWPDWLRIREWPK
jgi:protein gp37